MCVLLKCISKDKMLFFLFSYFTFRIKKALTYNHGQNLLLWTTAKNGVVPDTTSNVQTI